MKNNIKRIKEEVQAITKEKEFIYDEDNRMIINMEVSNDDNFLDTFSQKEHPVISSDIANYLEKVTTSIKPTEKFRLKIYSNCIDDEEKIIYTNAIKNYYIDRYLVESRQLKNNRKIALILGLIGIFALALAIILEYREKNELWMRVIDIISWVFIWETVDILAFRCKELRLKQIRYLNFIDMQIEYI